MNRKAFWFFRSVLVLSAMLALSLGYVQAQITGFIPVFVDEFGSEDASDIFQDTDGNVGIGTTNPQAKLEVTGGDLRVSGDVYARGRLIGPSGPGGDELFTETWENEICRGQEKISNGSFIAGAVGEETFSVAVVNSGRGGNFCPIEIQFFHVQCENRMGQLPFKTYSVPPENTGPNKLRRKGKAGCVAVVCSNDPTKRCSGQAQIK